MATLTFLNPDGGESPFELSGELSVGRDAGNDVVLPEGGLSRKHARFFEEGGQILVEDLGSSNGTFVDGERIEGPTPIQAGQEILLANVKVSLGAARRGAPSRQSTGVRKAAGSSARTGQIPAVSAGQRRSSSAPAPRPTSGGRGVPARRSGAGAPPPAEEGAGGARAVLKGQTGPWAGKRYPLSKVVSVVGRVEGNDVVVEDDSVSRRHAEIRKSGPGYVVRDLNSANGSFVNGERITEAPLRPGDVLKFGVIEFGYSGPAPGAAALGPVDPAKKKKLILMGGGGLVLLLVIGVVVSQLTAAPPPVDMGPAAGAQAGPDPQQLLGMCRSFSDPDGNTLDWTRAIEACEAVLKADPINVDARKLKKTSEMELAEKKLYDRAHELYNLAQEEEALVEYMKIDKTSFYFRPARAEFRKAAPIVMKRKGDICIAQWKYTAYDKAWAACKSYEDFGCYLGTDDRTQRPFLELQKRFKGKDDWTCPAAYAPFLQDVGHGDDLKTARHKAIQKMYGDATLAKAVDRYAADPIAGMQAVQKYQGHGGKDIATAKHVFQLMTLFYSRHQNGYERILKNDLVGAAKAFKESLGADEQIMPKDDHGNSFSSDLAGQMRTEISDKFAEKGKMYFTQGRLPEAFKQCEGGAAFTHANPNISACYGDLENTAFGLVDEGCDGLKNALLITRPESLPHKNAEKKAKEEGCR